MKFTPYKTERTEDRIIDLFQDAVAEFIRRINETFITSGRIARNSFPVSRASWVAINTALAEEPIWIAPHDVIIHAITWCGTNAVAVDPQGYRGMRIGRYRDGVAAGTVASRNTGSGGNAITAFTPWALTLSSDASVYTLKEGDVLTVEMSEVHVVLHDAAAIEEGNFTIDFEIIREVESA